MSGKTVSVVMATYNGSKYIGDQLESLVSQSVLPLEIIVSDDNSTDDTLDIVGHIKDKSKVEVRILRNDVQLGFRDNFLKASLQARGDFIAFCDQDDIWRLDKIEQCSAYFNDLTVSLIVHSAKTINDRSDEIGEFRQGIRGTRIRPPLSYDPWGTFWGFSVIFRREILNIVHMNDRFIDYISPSSLIAHDRWINFIGQMVGSTVEIDECLVQYRQHQNNLFGQGKRSLSSAKGNLKERSMIYIEATSKMLDVICSVPEATVDDFPLYDRNKCVEFVKRALEQLQKRHDIYVEKTRLESVKRVVTASLEGIYRGVHDDRMRWRSLARDLRYIALRT